jgi:5-methyltetrahydrofolate--homocysteine methyltransferase
MGDIRLKNFLKEMKDNVLVYDGSKGYMLQLFGLKGGECPELWNAEHSNEVRKVYSLYKDAGSDVIQTNTFQGNRIKLEEYSLGNRTYELNFKAAQLAREVMGHNGYVAASIGPIGKLFEPSGELTFNKAYETYKEQVKAVVDGGVDIINFETFTDLAEMRAALLAAKDVTELPVICSLAFEANGRTLMGTDPYTAGVVLKSLGADMIGTNCSFGPEHMLDIIKKMGEVGGIYLSAKPNAGLPELIDGKTVYNESIEDFTEASKEFIKHNVRLLGGCCGTTPEFIKEIKASLKGIEIPKLKSRCEKVITSNTKLLSIENIEKINAGSLNSESDKELFDQLRNLNFEYIIDTAMDLSSEGYEAVYIKVDSVNGDELLLSKVVDLAQGYLKEPFILETKNCRALENALRIYRGKAGVIVNGYPDNEIEELLMVAMKYGSTIIDKNMV